MQTLDNTKNYVSQINANVKSFDGQNTIVGGGINKAINSIPINNLVNDLKNKASSVYNKTINSVTDEFYGGDLNNGTPPGLLLTTVPNGFVLTSSLNYTGPWLSYQGPGGNIIYTANPNSSVSSYNTSVDLFAILANQNPTSRIIDDVKSAKQYLNVNNPANKFSDIQRSDLTSHAGSIQSLLPSTSSKKLTVSGIPTAIPGQLNVGLTVTDPANLRYVEPIYTNPNIPASFNVKNNVIETPSPFPPEPVKPPPPPPLPPPPPPPPIIPPPPAVPPPPTPKVVKPKFEMPDPQVLVPPPPPAGGSTRISGIFLPSTTSANGGYRGYFDGINSLLTIANNSQFDFSNSIWTAECWIYVVTAPSLGKTCRLIMAGADNSFSSLVLLAIDSTLKISATVPKSGVNDVFTVQNAITIRTWNHVAVSVSGRVARIYVNGVRVGYVSDFTAPTSAVNKLQIGFDTTTSNDVKFNGYISNLRIVNGTALYTQDFIPQRN